MHATLDSPRLFEDPATDHQATVRRERRGTGEHRPAPFAETAKSLPYLLDVDGLAVHLCITRRHVYRLVNERRVPHLKFGGKLRFDPAKIAAWLQEAERLPSGRLR